MIRVLEVLATLKRAGAEGVAAALARGLDRRSFQAQVLSLYDAFPDGLEPDLASSGVPVTHLGKRRGFDPRMFGRVRQVIREFHPHIVHTHSYVLRYVMPVSEAIVVHTVHNVATREVDWTGQLIHRIAFRRGVLPVAVAPEIAASFQVLYGFAPRATILNGIDTAELYQPESRAIWRSANGFNEDDLLVVSVARLEPQKNPLGLVEAFRRAAVPKAHLLLVGEGSLRSRIEGDRIHLLGTRSDIPELLSACDVFALASAWEGHPLALLEAMAAGLPVVATGVGGVPGVITEGSGLLVPADDLNAFARALKGLLTNTHERRRLGQCARERAADFDVRVMVAEYARLFEEVAGCGS